MMCVLFLFFVIGFLFGTVVTREANIDINRLRLLSNEAFSSRKYPSPTGLPHRYNQFKRSNDLDYNSSWFDQPRAPVQSIHDALTVPPQKAIKVYPSREDPRLFYQSESYIKENYRKDIDRHVSLIYPGNEVVQAGEYNYRFSLPLADRNANRIRPGYNNMCVKCPHDRTLIAKPGADRVMLQYPRLTTCSGLKAPRDVRFTSLYGPKFGSLVTQGSHIVIGRITYKEKDIQMCEMKIHVIMQSCPVPSYLVSDCDERTTVCQFSCRDASLVLHGHSALSCGDAMGWMGWTGNLPYCRARTWCDRPDPPDHGHLICKGSPEGSGLAEGSTCRVRCARGWHWSPRAVTVCRRGAWTFNVTCTTLKRNFRGRYY